jgi:hypothetical protein
MGMFSNACKVLDEKPEGKRPFWRPTPTWEDNIGTDLREIMWELVD